ncbi:NUDIX hydrolase [Roseibium sp. RKSG952]|uniref:NUDIX hydrolase n=1 Tax=Roseibium sp. RKSG952 TaxID=2529384 RepID=UPI0012BB97AA|nr:NUDIX hydrolase [Roseibium sp. RKSG952]
MTREISRRKRKKKAAGCLVLSRRTGRFLFCRRPAGAPAAGKWSLWAGKTEQGENPSETARRELCEETGLEIIEFPEHVHRMTTSAFQFDTFCVVVDDEFMPKRTAESDGYAWAPLEGVPTPVHWGLEKLLSDKRAISILSKVVERESGRPCAPEPFGKLRKSRIRARQSRMK